MTRKEFIQDLAARLAVAVAGGPNPDRCVNAAKWAIEIADQLELNKDNVEEIPLDIMNRNIRNSGMSVRAINGLICSGVNTVEDLLRCEQAYVHRFRNLGSKTMKEIEGYLTSIGYGFAALPPIWIRLGDTANFTNGRGRKVFDTDEECKAFVDTENAKIKGL